LSQAALRAGVEAPPLLTYCVERAPGRSPHHATVVGLSPDEASRLLTPTIPNPAKKP
jgi:hypothetical protein